MLKQEEERFFKTIATGMELLESALANGAKQVDGETAFKLYDTYGFPVDLTADVCRERGMTVDEAGFERLLEEQRARGRNAGKFKMSQGLAYTGGATTFHGYEHLSREDAKVVALYIDGSPVQSAWRRARRASWCWTTRRSTPSPAARSATGASCATRPRASSSTTR